MAAFRDARQALEHLHAELRTIAIDEPLARLAGDLAEEHRLRGSDAVHLASAHSIDAEDVLLATWDKDLGRPARATGRPVIDQAG